MIFEDIIKEILATDARIMRAVVRHTTQYHPSAMDRMLRHLELKGYWNLLDFDGAISKSLHRQILSNLCQVILGFLFAFQPFGFSIC